MEAREPSTRRSSRMQNNPKDVTCRESFISYGNRGTREEVTHGVLYIFGLQDEQRDSKLVC